MKRSTDRTVRAAALCIVLAACGASNGSLSEPATQERLPPPATDPAPSSTDAIADAADDGPTARSDSGGNDVLSGTIFPPPLPAPAGEVPISPEEMQRIAQNVGQRVTVAIDRDPDESLAWWLTTWSGTASTGQDVYCLGSSAQGVSCVPDRDELVHPVQIAGFSTEPPAAVVLVADPDVTEVAVRVDAGPWRRLGLTQTGVSSGRQVAGTSLGEVSQGGLRLEVAADRRDGDTYQFAVDLPAPDRSTPGQPAINVLDEAYAPVELLAGG
jgi:hypothetical protein